MVKADNLAVDSKHYVKDASSEMFGDISEWILARLSKSEKALNNLPPCPYAKEALLNKDLQIFQAMSSEIDLSLSELFERFSEFGKKVLILCCEANALSLQKTEELVIKHRNQQAPSDFWLMYDHPSEDERVGDVDFSNGRYLLFFVQRLSDLIEKSEDLISAGYYKNWPELYFSQVVKNRSSHNVSNK